MVCGVVLFVCRYIQAHVRHRCVGVELVLLLRSRDEQDRLELHLCRREEGVGAGVGGVTMRGEAKPQSA